MNKEQPEQKWEELRGICLATFKGVNRMSDDEFGKYCFDAGIEAMQSEIESLKAEIAKRDEADKARCLDKNLNMCRFDIVHETPEEIKYAENKSKIIKLHQDHGVCTFTRGVFYLGHDSRNKEIESLKAEIAKRDELLRDALRFVYYYDACTENLKTERRNWIEKTKAILKENNNE